LFNIVSATHDARVEIRDSGYPQGSPRASPDSRDIAALYGDT
jgi:hypothetical protein